MKISVQLALKYILRGKWKFELSAFLRGCASEQKSILTNLTIRCYFGFQNLNIVPIELEN